MNKTHLITEIVTTYKKHGWELKRVLLTPDSNDELTGVIELLETDVEPELSSFDALWFTRPSHRGAEAWELRLLAETPYALFERIEQDELDKREAILSDTEQRMADYVSGS
jgi:hypothetical protein